MIRKLKESKTDSKLTKAIKSLNKLCNKGLIDKQIAQSVINTLKVGKFGDFFSLDAALWDLNDACEQCLLAQNDLDAAIEGILCKEN